MPNGTVRKKLNAGWKNSALLSAGRYVCTSVTTRVVSEIKVNAKEKGIRFIYDLISAFSVKALGSGNGRITR